MSIFIPLSQVSRIRKLNLFRELRECFAGSKIVKLRVTFMAETLIAIGSNLTEKSSA